VVVVLALVLEDAAHHAAHAPALAEHAVVERRVGATSGRVVSELTG
jgi:hypothetical protein